MRGEGRYGQQLHPDQRQNRTANDRHIQDAGYIAEFSHTESKDGGKMIELKRPLANLETIVEAWMQQSTGCRISTWGRYFQIARDSQSTLPSNR